MWATITALLGMFCKGYLVAGGVLLCLDFIYCSSRLIKEDFEEGNYLLFFFTTCVYIVMGILLWPMNAKFVLRRSWQGITK